MPQIPYARFADGLLLDTTERTAEASRFLGGQSIALLATGGVFGPIRGVKVYEVGTAESLLARSVKGNKISIHHVGQAHAMERLIAGYSRSSGPAIAVPTAEHVLIPNLRGTVALTPRELLARDIRNLRYYTNAPNSSLEELITINKKLYPGVFGQ